MNCHLRNSVLAAAAAMLFVAATATAAFAEERSVWGRASYGPGGVATEAGVIAGSGAFAGTITMTADVNSGRGVASLSVAGPGGSRTSSNPVQLTAAEIRALQELVTEVEKMGAQSGNTRKQYAGSEAHYGSSGTRSRGRSGGPDGNASLTISYSVDYARGEVAVGIGAAIAAGGDSDAARVSTSDPLGLLLAAALTDLHNKIARGAVFTTQPVQTQPVQRSVPVQRSQGRRVRRFRRWGRR